MEEVTYSNSLVLKVQYADNLLRVDLSPDRYKAGAEIYMTDNWGAPTLDDSIDVKAMASKMNPCVFCAVGANFESGGHFKFQLIADGKKVLDVDENLPTWSTKMWTRELKRV